MFKRTGKRQIRFYLFFAGGLIVCHLLPRLGIINPYVQDVIKYIGINIILALSLNLINGYMGEFSVGHAGFMAVGAYVASILTVRAFPDNLTLNIAGHALDFTTVLFPLLCLRAGLLRRSSG